ncbi:MAG: hypothetical protein LBR16_07270, partial [Treponema sp.]|nr:hypothetical protein [Treponema sp.]
KPSSTRLWTPLRQGAPARGAALWGKPPLPVSAGSGFLTGQGIGVYFFILRKFSKSPKLESPPKSQEFTFLIADFSE